MKVEQIYTGCLSQGAYYIESNGEVAIIDPLRESQAYIDKANLNNAKIKYIFETHFHADFVSGHVTLSEKTGAPIIYGPTATPDFESIIAEDGQVFNIGDITITVLHTPGHTMESTTYLLKNAEGRDHAIFTGDTLFLGDVGRPDLAQKMGSLTTEDLAGFLYDSLRNKIMLLSDEVIVYPGHGAGSACGKNMMNITVDTLGSQKKMNYALRADMTKEEFVNELTDGLAAPPAYFPLNVQLNKEGYEDVEKLVVQGMRSLNVAEFKTLALESNAVMLDVRHQKEFIKGHIPNSIFIGLNGSFAPWVGALLKDIYQPILLIADKHQIEDAIIRLSRVGFDNVLGYLENGIEGWQNAGEDLSTIKSISATELHESLKEVQDAEIVDVRKSGEYHSGHIQNSENYPLSEMVNHLEQLSSKDKFYLHCAGGYRSVIAISILKSRGIHNAIDIAGGYNAIKETGIELVEQACSMS